MPKVSEIKKNAAVEYDGNVYFVKDIERSVPQGRAGGSIYRMRMYNVVTGAKLDESFKDSDMLNLADLTIADEALFIAEDTQNLQVVVLNDAPVGVDLPGVVELVIVDTAPAMKGSSATSRTKPATLTTGLVVQVPEHISTGDRIRVNVEECKFTGRA